MCNLDDWLQYSPELYADRSEIQREIEEWLAAATPDKRVFSVVGPPGVGKSWLLKNVMEQYGAKQLVLWFYAPDLVAESEATFQKALYEKITHYCPGIAEDPFIVSQEFPAFIENITKILCGVCQNPKPLIVVDGSDNIDVDVSGKIQRRFLRPFFHFDHQDKAFDIFRMLIARRSPLGDAVLRNKEQLVRLDAFDQSKFGNAEDQIRRLIQRFQPHVQDWQLYREYLPPGCRYRWNHPFINTYLLCHVFRFGSIQAANLMDCCTQLINRPQIGGRSGSIEEDCESLLRLSTLLPDRWNLDDFKRLTKKTSDDLGWYLARGIVVKTDIGQEQTATYCIADGLREVLRDFAFLRQKERTR